MRLDHIYEGASPVGVSQAGLIRLSGPARAIALNVLRVNSLQTGAYVSRFRGRGLRRHAHKSSSRRERPTCVRCCQATVHGVLAAA